MALEGSETEESPEMETNDDITEKTEHPILEDPSPRCVLEIPISGTDSDHSRSSSSSSCSSGSTEKLVPERTGIVRESNGIQWKQILDSFKKKSVRRFSVIPLISTYETIARKNLRRKLARIQHSADVFIDCEGIMAPKPSWRNFDYLELEAATDNFSSENLIGEGGHAKVYKGCLSDGQVVAVKKLMKTEKQEEDRVGDFLSELGIIAHINHPNAARLLGFSIDSGLHLVLEFLPHGSLASVLHGGSDCLEWKKRFKVALGIAEGLQYLHHDCPRRIIHRDIKASNILLNANFEAQISDFGLAKWLPENWIHHIVFPIEGTFGYLAPEYFMHGIVDEKTDVFAYGVLLLEIITGRRAVDSSRQSLVMWAKPLLEANNAKELADPRLGDDYDPIEMKHAMFTALMCIHHLPSTRPHMIRVVQLLRGEEAPVEFKQKTNAGRAVLLDGCDLQDYTCTTYLKDLNRHMQLVME
ncbi:receptor-like cytosolic serine/threonine-protein kinase RBK1 [Populus alba]|uniref:non-specific serine/threonine protein kinase n=2 Tax=Populus TaxID=3689 RepID=A0A4U5PXN8_POPAL|nr:receptor-like cytosolic serine/threonine-protein kinase RBK1 [Populus alba]KAJ6989815.1 receptor-like cytosolic serine/threonine-protein kinase RBK1 [Populus alba x Populus x berolinensis]TKS02333.1 receptor-like cytosolic serine/threonine-protein kinase RBK1 isoform X1 [Populus alba]